MGGGEALEMRKTTGAEGSGSEQSEWEAWKVNAGKP